MTRSSAKSTASMLTTTPASERSITSMLAELPRLILTPHRRNFGRFRKLIDAINLAEVDEKIGSVASSEG